MKKWITVFVSLVISYGIVSKSEEKEIVDFHIEDGTGKGPWNTEDDMVEVEEGQILRIHNDDSIKHRLHTGGTPCPHGPEIKVGKSWDCHVTKPYDPNKDSQLYDHYYGSDARFYVKTTSAKFFHDGEMHDLMTEIEEKLKMVKKAISGKKVNTANAKTVKALRKSVEKMLKHLPPKIDEMDKDEKYLNSLLYYSITNELISVVYELEYHFFNANSQAATDGYKAIQKIRSRGHDLFD